jgi:phospholipase/carboxylesterase
MHRPHAWRWLLLALMIGSAPSAAQAPAEAVQWLPDATPDASGWGVAAGLRYLEIIRGGANPKDKLPMLLVIHGLGDKPDPGWLHAIDLADSIKARMILPEAPTPHGQGFSWFDYRAASLDQVALAHNITAIEARVAQMIEVLVKQRPTRGQRVVVTGFSQGGMLSYTLAVQHPALIELALPISGMLPAPLWPEHARADAWAPRTHALHGTSDDVVRMAVDQQLVEHLKGLGYAAELVAFEGVGHVITPAMSAEAKRVLSEALAPAPAPAAAERPSRKRRGSAVRAQP